MVRRLILAVVLALAFTQPVGAQDFYTGRDAYERKDYATALRELTPLAEDGPTEP
jgi:uncharacterized protein